MGKNRKNQNKYCHKVSSSVDCTQEKYFKPCDSSVSHSLECHSESKDCEKKCFDKRERTAKEILCEFRNAIVEVHSQFILLGEGVTNPTGETQQERNTRVDITLEGNGFFVKDHYIITPAHLVLLPPSLTSVVNRYPFFDPQNLALGRMRNQMIRATKILVSVFNVNNKDCSYIYEAELIGVDGAGDLAILRIIHQKRWNNCLPEITCCHPYLHFGKSNKACPGEPAYLIGDFIGSDKMVNNFNAAGCISEGLIADNKYLEYSGWMLPEAVLVSANAYSQSSGLPILNKYGQVIGMQTTDLAAVNSNFYGPLESMATVGFGFVAGPSSAFMKKIIKALVCPCNPNNFNCKVDLICDPLGSFTRYRKGYLGLAYEVFNGASYNTFTNYISGDLNAGRPTIRLDDNGELIDTPSCKDLRGIRVLGLAGANPNPHPDPGTFGPDVNIAGGFYHVPGGTGISPLPDLLPTSPMLNSLNPGDIIISMNGVTLGDLKDQFAPSLLTWCLREDDQIEVVYRRYSNLLAENNTNNQCCGDSTYAQKFCLRSYPLFMDYPWYAVRKFPLLSTQPFPDFTFPNGQIRIPQVPDFSNTNSQFRPAI